MVTQAELYGVQGIEGLYTYRQRQQRLQQLQQQSQQQQIQQQSQQQQIQQQSQQQEQQPKTKVYYGERLESGDEGPRIVTDIGKSRAELEAIQSESRKAGYPYDIREGYQEDVYEGQPKSGYITSSPDRARAISSIQIVQDVVTGKNVPFSESTQFQRQQSAQQQLINLEKSIAQRPQIAGIRESVQKQILSQAQGDFGQRRLNLTPSERSQQDITFKQPSQIQEIRRGYQEIPEKREIFIKQERLRGGDELATTFRPTSNIYGIPSDVQGRQMALQKSQKQGLRERFEQKLGTKTEEFQKAGEEFTLFPKSEQEKYALRGSVLSIGYIATRETGVFTYPYLHPVKAITGIFKPETYIGIYKGLKEEPKLTILDLLVGKKAFDVGIKGVQVGRAKATEVSRNIRLNQEFIKTGKEVIPFEELPKEITTPPGRELSQEIRVRELKGAESLFIVRKEGFGAKGAAIQKPIFAPPEYVKAPKQPDLILATAEETLGRTTKRVLGKETQIPQTAEELANIQARQRVQKVLTPEEARQFATPRQAIAFVGGQPISTLRTDIVGTSSIFFRPIEARGGLPSTIKKPQPRGQPSTIRTIEGSERARLVEIRRLPTETIAEFDTPTARITIRYDALTGRVISRKVTPKATLMQITEKATGKTVAINVLGQKTTFIQPIKPQGIIKPAKEIISPTGLVQVLEKPKVKAKQEAKIIQKKKPEVESGISVKQDLPFIETIEEPLSQAARERVGLFFAERGTARVRVTPKPGSILKLGLRSSILAAIAQRPTQAQPQIISQTPRQIPTAKVIQKPSIIQEVSQAPKQIPKQDIFISPAQSISQIPIQTPAQTPAQDVFQELLTTPETITDIFRPRGPPPPPPEKPFFKFKKILSSPEKEISREQAYDVYIKSKLQKLIKGRYRSRGFYKANKQPLTKEAAKGLLFSILDTYANRSGFLKETAKAPRTDLTLEQLAKLIHKFRQSKRNPNIFVEKSEYAIDNPIEVKQIPYEAIKQKRKRLQQKILQFRQQKNFLRIKQRQRNAMFVSNTPPKTSKQDIFFGKSRRTKRFTL